MPIDSPDKSDSNSESGRTVHFPTNFPFTQALDDYCAQPNTDWLYALVDSQLDVEQVQALKAAVGAEALFCRYPMVDEETEQLTAQWVILGQEGQLYESRLLALHDYLLQRDQLNAPYCVVSIVQSSLKPVFLQTHTHSCSRYSVKGEEAGMPIPLEWPSHLCAFFAVLTPGQQAGFLLDIARWHVQDEHKRLLVLSAPDLSPERGPYPLDDPQSLALERRLLPQLLVCQLLARLPQQVPPELKRADLLRVANAVIDELGQRTLPALLVQTFAARLNSRMPA